MAQDESPFVVFYEMQNAGGTATLHITHRALPGETYDVFMARVMASIVSQDPKADIALLFKDAPKGWGGGKGGSWGGKAVTEIKNGEFVITHVERVERPNKKLKPDGTAGDPWIDFVAFGQQDGAEVRATCFFGSGSWMKPDNAVAVSGLFPNFLQYKLGERKAVPAAQVWIAHVTLNQSYKRYEITSITST